MSLTHTDTYVLLLPLQARGLRNSFQFPDHEARTLSSNNSGNSSQHGQVLHCPGCPSRRGRPTAHAQHNPSSAPFRDVTQSAPAPRVRTSRPEVWAPEAQPFPAREALAPPVSVGTERGGVQESRRLKLVVRCGAASPPCVIMKSSVPPDPERRRRARGAGTPFDLFLEKFAVLSRRNTSRLATCFTDLHL